MEKKYYYVTAAFKWGFSSVSLGYSYESAAIDMAPIEFAKEMQLKANVTCYHIIYSEEITKEQYDNFLNE